MDIQPISRSVIRARSKEAENDLWAVFNMVSSPRYYLGPESKIGYHNPEVYSMLDQMSHAVDPEDLDRIYHQLAVILKKDQPVTFLMPRVITFIAHRRLRGLSSPFHSVPARHMEDLWIAKE